MSGEETNQLMKREQNDKTSEESLLSVKEENDGLASFSQLFDFGKEPSTRMLILAGVFFAVIAGSVGPVMIWYYAKSFEDLSADPNGDEFMDEIRHLAFTFLVLGAIAFTSLSAYSMLLQTAANRMAINLKTQWYQALLRQDMAYFDIQDVSGTATIISRNAAKYERGVGNKLGLFVQFVCTFLGGIIYSFYASWQTSLVVLLTVPFMAVSGWFVVKLTTSESQRTNKAYASAGALVYTTVSSIRTIISLNGARAMIARFKEETQNLYTETISDLHWLGVANGAMMSSFLLSSVAVPLYGGFLLYDQVEEKGCDPSGAVPGVPTCDPSGVDIFGAMFGIFFAASVLPQISTTLEAFTEARAACYLGLKVMQRGRTEKQATDSEPIPILPHYNIDSSSDKGLKPNAMDGQIVFHNVDFAYPARKEVLVLKSLSLTIPSGKTTALVGPSGSGKSTIAQLVERFYDPINDRSTGSICVDGNDYRDLNVRWLRDRIGFVSQEPTLFATSIRENIAFGLPSGTATHEQIEHAAKIANAHEFIMSFPDGYDTQVGDKGTKLSGGQKQRIAIARTIIKKPKILVLDEATSALDSESERLVQGAIDNLLSEGGRTTIVIAHRLSTIRNADKIVVLEDGQLVEEGTHMELSTKGGKFAALIEAQETQQKQTNGPSKNSFLEVSTSANLIPSELSNGERTPLVRFSSVDFAYPSRPLSKVLKNLSLSIYTGETVALVGPSGHGKSTIVQLLERFYDPQSGSVEFEGENLRSRSPHWLRNRIGLVSQEPTLLDGTIAENIRFGLDGGISNEEMEEASRKANAHDFIMEFPDGYETQVGTGGTQVSGGQKQRICIARALMRRPKLLLLDEATSALDSEAERMVQEAIGSVSENEDQTTLVIAHRLSTIRNADRIAVIVDGTVAEIGSYDELMAKDDGYFRRLQAFQGQEDPSLVLPQEEAGQNSTGVLAKKVKALRAEKQKKREEHQEEEEEFKEIDKKRETQNASRARHLAKGDGHLFFVGSVGAVLTGAIFPAWGFIFAYMVELLYTPVGPCDFNATPEICQSYWDTVVDDMKKLSKSIAYGSVATIVAAMAGYVILFYGFGRATARMNKRVRDQVFVALIRQEVAFFDQQPAGRLTSQLQDDAALIHSFSGEPIRTLVINVSSVVVGLIIGFSYMWQFALLFLGILPFMGFGAEMEMRMYVTGEDEGDDDDLTEEEHSPGGIVIESLLNIRTVASLSLEDVKRHEYHMALWAEHPHPLRTNFWKGSGFGLGQFFQFWGLGLMFWFGGWLLQRHGDEYEFRDFIICMFSLFFSIYGLTVAMEGATDGKRAKLAADRIFRLLDRPSAIDPLEDDISRSKESIGHREKAADDDSSSEEVFE